jgi:ATP-binding cassette, subfamily C, bacteriocin exporter
MLKKFKITLQQDKTDCGVACLLSIIKYYNGNNTIENLRRLSGTNINGTTLLGLYQAAQQIGFITEGCEADIESLVNHNQPCILHVTLENTLQHYIVYFGIDTKSKKLIIGDPSKGIELITCEELNKIWLSKSCLILKPNNNFVCEIETTKAKHRWIKNLIRDDASFLMIAAMLGIVLAILSLSMAIFSQRLVDDIIPKRNVEKLNLGIVLVCIILIVKEGISVLRQHILIRQTKSFNTRIIHFFFSHLLKLPKFFFDTRKIGELTARLNDTSRIQKVITQLASNVAIDLLMVIVSTSAVFFYSSFAGYFSLTIIPIFFFLIYKYNKKIVQGQKDIMGSYAQTESNYISTLQGIDPIKNHNKQNLYSNINNDVYRNFQEKIFVLGKLQIRLGFIVNSLSIGFLICILFHSSNEVLNNHIKIGQLVAILSLCGSLLPSVANLALITIPINEAKIAFDRMFEFTAISPENEKDSIDIHQFYSLQIQNLSFRFAGRSQLLKNISFDIKKGEIIALMGENGCGKSTLIQVIQKYYLQENGNIVINQNTQLKNISYYSWRNICAVVPQNIHIFNGTVLKNIAFEDATTKTNEVITFLTQNGFFPFLDFLPQSVFTLIGEEGINLSGGQKQIIAIARALYTVPKLLILDEATSAMDRESEQFILKLLKQNQHKMAIIFVTHRLHILKTFCDRICIISNGKIDAFGTHQQLLETKNLYSNFWKDLG